MTSALAIIGAETSMGRQRVNAPAPTPEVLAPMQAHPTKRCLKCGEVKPLEAFNRYKRSRDGRRQPCRACQRAMASVPCVRCGDRANRDSRPYRGIKTGLCNSCASAVLRSGANHWAWIGNEVSLAGSYHRAIKAIPAQPCEVCGALKTDRHHINHDTLDNRLENIRFLCRSHHQLHHLQERREARRKKDWTVVDRGWAPSQDDSARVKWHYFKCDGRSLCGVGGVLEGQGVFGDDDAMRYCARCKNWLGTRQGKWMWRSA